MARKNEAGFTLIELIVAMAISSALAVIVFAGQRSLRSQAQFDADVNKIVSSIAAAHTEATAAVNLGGPGDGTRNCLGTPIVGGAYVFAGVAWSGIDAPGGGTYRVDYYAADRTGTPAVACVFDSRQINLPSSVRVNPAPGTGLARSLFIRNDSGGLNVCAVTNLTTNVLTSFVAGNCVSGAVGNTPLVLNLSDAEGHTSRVQVDPSGLAQRIN